MHKKQRIHFIGIGGIGVSALAQYYLGRGHRITGSDLTASEITASLKKLGAKIHIGNPRPELITSRVGLVVYSPAVPPTNPEFQKAYIMKASQPNFRLLSYPEALGELTKTHYTIAVSGTHGKSTTTSMIGLLLWKAGLDPTVIVGTRLKEFGDTNCRVGKSRYLVIEADEHFASFLNYWPKIIVLTTIEADHLDYYKNLSNVIRGFKKYISHLPKDGFLVANQDDKNIQKILYKIQNTKYKIQYYSLSQKEAEKLRNLLKIPGEHNVSNALAALAVARILGIPDAKSFKALGEYHGSWRRFEVFQLFRPKRYTLISDYGHHPTEIKVTVEAARSQWPEKTLWLVFQPHQYARTFYLFKDFVKVLAKAPVDKLIITDIYDVAGREDDAIRKKVSSEQLVEAIQKIENSKVLYLPTLKEVEAYLKKNLKGGEVVMVMGAGDIYNLTLRLCLH